MNGMDILNGLEYIGSDLVELAEFGPFSAGAEKEKNSPRKVRRHFLLAALIALLLVLVGCAAVYILKMQDVKIGEGTHEREFSLIDGVYVEDRRTIPTNTLTLAGVKGTDAYQACAAFYTYKREHRTEMLQLDMEGGLEEGYWGGGFQSDLDAKALELAAQYGLKPEGTLLGLSTMQDLYDALGVEGFTRQSNAMAVEIENGGCYESGNFWVNVSFQFPEDSGYEVTFTNGTLRWNRTDSFSRDYVTLEDNGDWSEWNYTTASGNPVLILYSPSCEASYLFCSREEALLSLEIVGNIMRYSEEPEAESPEFDRMTKQQLEMVADSIDFDIHPRIPVQ